MSVRKPEQLPWNEKEGVHPHIKENIGERATEMKERQGCALNGRGVREDFPEEVTSWRFDSKEQFGDGGTTGGRTSGRRPRDKGPEV